jgi:Spirocyclase AveC-like
MATFSTHRRADEESHPRPSPTPPVVADRTGPVAVWAAVGVVWLVVGGQAVIRWIFCDTEFAPAPRRGPDRMDTGQVLAIRVFEAISFAVLVALVWYCVVRPWRREGTLSLDGKFVLGGMAAFIADGFLDVHTYLFAWNSYSINMGVWTRYLPFHNPDMSSRYAESLLWGPPMYVYFCAGVAIAACQLVRWLRARWPRISYAGIFVVVYLVEFAFDFVVENLAIRTTQAYGFAQTYGPLTLWSGSQYQFPLYESVLVAALGTFYTWARLRALESPDGLSPIERGFERFRPGLQPAVRTFAVIGFCSAATILVYHLPLNWLGLVGDATAVMPSYMLSG